MKKQFLILGFVVLAMLLLSFENGIESNGAPVGSTGAPAEQTCAKSTCHGDYAVNAGAGLLDIDFNNGAATYEPGQTYTVTISLNQQDINRFGFQLAVLKKNDNTEAGTLQITDSARTQVLKGLNQYAGRSYVTYRYAGTEPFADNLGHWSFRWTAPQTNEGGIVFYYAGVAANDDGTDYGDLVYTKQLELSPALTGVKGEEATASGVRVFPNPAKDFVNVQYEVEQPGTTTVQLFDMSSQQAFLVSQYFDKASANNLRIDLSNRFAPGVYLLTISNGENVQTKKIIIE